MRATVSAEKRNSPFRGPSVIRTMAISVSGIRQRVSFFASASSAPGTVFGSGNGMRSKISRNRTARLSATSSAAVGAILLESRQRIARSL
jgi:hypothetical protein